MIPGTNVTFDSTGNSITINASDGEEGGGASKLGYQDSIFYLKSSDGTKLDSVIITGDESYIRVRQ